MRKKKEKESQERERERRSRSDGYCCNSPIVKRTYIIDHGISLCHQTGDSRSMYNFAVITIEICPERAKMDFELIKAEGSHAFKKRVEVVLKPSPNFTGSHTVW